MKRALSVLALAGAIFSLSFAGYAAWDQDWTTDERIHLAWSARFWNTGETERDSVGRYESKTPIHLPNVVFRQWLEKRGIDAEQPRRFASRVPQLLWLVVTLIAAGTLASRLGGPIAGWLAVLFASVEPNLSANASVATTDIPLAAATVLSLWAAIAQRQEPGPFRAAVLGACLGLALVAKFAAVLLVPLALGVAFLKKGGGERRALGHVAVSLLCAWTILAAGYLGRGLFEPLSASAWRSELFQTVAARAPALPMPLPLAFVEGIDRSRARDARDGLIVTILGQVSDGPLWYYFVAAWSLKTPIALMVITLAFVPWLVRNARGRPEIAALLVHQAVTGLFVSFALRTQLGYRYALMLIPITCALIAIAAASSLKRRSLVAVALLAALFSVAESARFWGDPLAFSNAVVQPKKKAYLFLANADIDWNQNRERWSQFQRAAGLPDNGALNPPDLIEGLNVLSTSTVAGVFPGDRFKWARENLEPRAMAGWTHHYFDVTREQYDRFLNEERRLSPTPGAEEACGLSASQSMDPPGIETTFERVVSPSGPRLSKLCVATRRGTDLLTRTLDGRFDLIPLTRPNLATLLQPGERVIFRLDPGVHLFQIRETPYRRDTVPYSLSVRFASVEYGALLRILPES